MLTETRRSGGHAEQRAVDGPLVPLSPVPPSVGRNCGGPPGWRLAREAPESGGEYTKLPETKPATRKGLRWPGP
eukprot:7746855-Pyramimonas_sp.AAC.1